MARVVVLNWRVPALESAGAWLVERFARRGSGWGELDLSGLVLVTPGRRAGRILLAMLVDRAEREGLGLTPPRLATPADLTRLLIEDNGRMAGPAATRLAFIEAALGLDDEDRAALVGERAAAPEQARAAADLALRATRELAGQGVPIERVESAASELVGEREARRWRAVGRLWESARRCLAEHGLEEPSAALLQALAGAGAGPPTGTGVVLVGVPELPGAVRRVLAAMGESVTALVFGDEASAFDGLGAICPGVWRQRAIDLSRAAIEFVEDAREQAHAALAALADWADRHPPDRLSIGAPDPEVAFWIERLAERTGGVEVRDAAGWPVERTAPWRLLEACADLVRTRSFASLAALARHPDVEHHLRRRPGGADHLRDLDRFEREGLPRRAGQWEWVEGPPRHVLDSVWECVRDLLGGLWSDSEAPASPARWGAEALELLWRVYGERDCRVRVPEEARLAAACRILRDAAADLASAGTLGGDVSAWEGLHLVLSLARGGTIAGEPARDAVEMLGWLELPLDPSRAMVVTGLNEGAVPASRGVDGLLPERLRERLGLETDGTRAARDAYVLSTLAASGRELVLVAARRTGEGDPLLPSRLFFAGDDAHAVDRVRAFLGGTLRRRVLDEVDVRSGFVPSAEPAPPPVESVRVTSFARYLRSPYEFYLIDVLGLEEPEEPGDELEARVVGDLLHEVLRRFGSGDRRHEPDPRRLEHELLGHLGDLLRERFGSDAGGAGLPPIPRVELEFVRRWLVSAAQWQARSVAEGWTVRHVEWSPSEPATFAVDGRPVILRGRIDRIDQGPDGALRIIDFKTGDAKDPDKAHRAGRGQDRRWTNLQLPLYRHLARELGPDDRFQLGFVGWSENAPVEWRPAKWTPEDLRSADEAAAEVVRGLRAGAFHETGDPATGDGVLAALVDRLRLARRARA